jgi:Pentapeptide repeats (8 copies)
MANRPRTGDGVIPRRNGRCVTVHSVATATSGTSAVIIAALVSGFGALIVGVLNYRAQGRVVVTSRFSQAVAQLGDENPDVRVGAIYALEQILHTSRPERRAIIELLVSYILGHASLAARRDEQPDDDASLDDLPNLRDWAPDVQAAVVVLSRRPRTTIREALRGSGDDHFHDPYGSAIIGVGHADLRRAELVDADLSGTRLYHVRFERAVLHRANLKGADLSRAHLERADLGDSTLIETKLVGAHLTEADLGGARLRGANLAEADLSRAGLKYADLRNADLRGTLLEDAVGLADAKLAGAHANEETTWPRNFSPADHGVRFGEAEARSLSAVGV